MGLFDGGDWPLGARSGGESRRQNNDANREESTAQPPQFPGVAAGGGAGPQREHRSEPGRTGVQRVNAHPVLTHF